MATLTPAQLRALAASVLPGAGTATLDTAVAIALAESRGNTGAISSTGDYGLWQINHRAHPNYDTAMLLTPLYNARAMAAISKGGTDWGPWTAFGTGAWKRFMPGGDGAGEIQGIGIPLPGGTLNVDVGIDDIPIVGDAAGVLTSWVEPLVSRAAVAVLALVFTGAGLTLFALGLFRLGASSSTVQSATKAAGAAAGGAGLVAALA